MNLIETICTYTTKTLVLVGVFAFAANAYAAGEGIEIHLAPTVIGHVMGFPVTNTLLTVWLAALVILGIALLVRKKLAMVPGKVQLIFELLIGTVYDYMVDVLGREDYARKFFPLVMTIFLFILIMNWVGLLPGVDAIGFYAEHAAHGEAQVGTDEGTFTPFFHPPATDLNITIAFALIAFIAIEVAGVALLGFFKYTGKFINFKGKNIGQRLLNFIIGIIELLSEVARLVSFSFRLFGNIFAGKTLILVAMFFVPFILPVPLLAFEVFVGFIQAFIFAILTLFFIKIAITEPH